LAEARKYNKRSDFRKGTPGAYHYATRHGLLDECCEQMEERFFWSFSLVVEEALKYKTRNEFHLNCPSAIQWAARNELLDEVCAHMEKLLTEWDYESCKAEALKYSSREEFRQQAAGAPQWAIRNGYWEAFCAHMENLNEPVTYEEAKSAALEYSTRGDFSIKNPRCYKWAMYNNRLDELCTHMIPGDTASDNDFVYIWKVAGCKNLYKFGVTSRRLGMHRLRKVAQAAGLKIGSAFGKVCAKATDVECELLKIGLPYEFSTPFNGSTEFRILNSHEFAQVTQMLSEATT
ncbi:hypothetical protein BOV94_12595, partial [Solemya velum gill symbiont]